MPAGDLRMLREFLTGKSAEANEHLERFWSQLRTSTPSVCWYPSAGECFRDLMVWKHWLGQEPDIFIHTDYWPAELLTKLREGNPVLHEDPNTVVRLTRASELELDRDIEYHVRGDFVDFADKANPEPRVQLLDITITSDICGQVSRSVLYFYFENLNWFEEFVLKRGLQVSHLFKLREGCGFGGNRQSVTVVYGFLGLMGCRFLLCDQEVHFDWDLFGEYNREYGGPANKAFAVQDRGNMGWLSGFEVKGFSVEVRQEPCSEEQIREALATITRGSPWDVRRER
jgi:hypothetical protein